MTGELAQGADQGTGKRDGLWSWPKEMSKNPAEELAEEKFSTFHIIASKCDKSYYTWGLPSVDVTTDKAISDLSSMNEATSDKEKPNSKEHTVINVQTKEPPEQGEPKSGRSCIYLLNEVNG